MKLTSVICAGFFALSAAGSAEAMTYDFSNSANPSGPFSLSCSAGGVLNSGCAVTYNNAGLGVWGIPDTDPGNIDSFPFASFETLIVSFTQPFMLQSFQLGNFDSRVDDYEYSINGGSFTASSSLNPALLNLSSPVNSFAVRASSFRLADLLAPDSFTLKSFAGVAAVPLPAGMVLLSSALGMLGVLGLRRRRTAPAAA